MKRTIVTLLTLITLAGCAHAQVPEDVLDEVTLHQINYYKTWMYQNGQARALETANIIYGKPMRATVGTNAIPVGTVLYPVRWAINLYERPNGGNDQVDLDYMLFYQDSFGDWRFYEMADHPQPKPIARRPVASNPVQSSDYTRPVPVPPSRATSKLI